MAWGLTRWVIFWTEQPVNAFIGGDSRRVWVVWGLLLCLWLGMLYGAAGAVRLVSGGRVALRAALAWLSLQELAVGPVWLWAVDHQYFGQSFSPVTLSLAGLGLVVALVLFLRVPLPEWLFPVRGRWLRVFLAALALLALGQLSPWWLGTRMFWAETAGRTLPPAHWWLPFLLGAALYLWLLYLTAGYFARRSRVETDAPAHEG